MKITILTAGTFGDIQPYVALGKRFKKEGWEVTLASHERFKNFIVSNNLNFHPVCGDPGELLTRIEGRELIRSGANPVKNIKNLIKLSKSLLPQIFDDCLKATENSDIIIHHISMALPAQSISEATGKSAYPFYLQHVHPTSKYPSFLSKPLSWNIPLITSLYNRATYILSDFIFWKMVQKIINNWRRSRLSLEPLEKLPFKKLSNQDLPFFYGFSKYVLPRAPEWRDNIHVTGYWFPDTSDRLKIPREVISFIEDGEKPVYFGFGSIPDSEAGVVLKEVIGAIKSTEERWVILKGWFEKSSVKLPDNVLLIGNIPHEWLFPQCKIVIHHGGAGTTASAIRAGVPQIVIPFYVDQIFWAWRVEKLGLGLKVPRGKLSSKTLISAINKIKSDRSFYKKSQELSSLVSSEKGVDTALRILKERYLLYH